MTNSKDKKIAGLVKKKLQELGKENANRKELKALKQEIKDDLKKQWKEESKQKSKQKLKQVNDELENILKATKAKHEKSTESELWKALTQAEAKYNSLKKKKKQKSVTQQMQLQAFLNKRKAQETCPSPSVVEEKQDKEGKAKKKGKQPEKSSLSKLDKKLFKQIQDFKKVTENGDNLTEEQLIKALITSLNEKGYAKKCSLLRVQWSLNPERQVDQECKDFYADMEIKAKEQKRDILTNNQDLKLFRSENSELFKKYNALLARKKKEKVEKTDILKIVRERKKAAKEAAKLESEALQAQEDRVSTDSGINKKIKFGEDDEDTSLESSPKKKKKSKENKLLTKTESTGNEVYTESSPKQKKKSKKDRVLQETENKAELVENEDGVDAGNKKKKKKSKEKGTDKTNEVEAIPDSDKKKKKKKKEMN